MQADRLCTCATCRLLLHGRTESWIDDKNENLDEIEEDLRGDGNMTIYEDYSGAASCTMRCKDTPAGSAGMQSAAWVLLAQHSCVGTIPPVCMDACHQPACHGMLPCTVGSLWWLMCCHMHVTLP